MEISKRVGMYCKLFRQNYLKISQSEIADMNGVTQALISQWENGKIRDINFLNYYLEPCNEREKKILVELIENGLTK